MQGVSSELLVYAAIVAAFLFFNYVMQRHARKAREAREARAQHAATTDADFPQPLDDHSWGGGSAVPDEVARARAMAVGAPLPVPTAALRKPLDSEGLRQRLRSREGLREAVVLMAILGPCRALEPYDPSARDRP